MPNRPPSASDEAAPSGAPGHDDDQNFSFDRRQLLIAATTLATTFGLPETGFAQGRTVSAIEFASLSNAVAGFPAADPDITAHFLEAFSDRMAELVDLLGIVRSSPAREWQQQIDAAGLTPLADALATAWYTGMVGEGDEQRVITYLDAFV